MNEPLQPYSLGTALATTRRLRGMKQSHIADLLQVTQSTVSRLERGEINPTGALRVRILELVSARLDPSRDSGLRRLVEMAAEPAHLVCDLTHRLLAASPTREREWGCTASELCGVSLWPYASTAIRSAEAALPELRWGTNTGAHVFAFTTGPNRSQRLRIAPSRTLWERILLADGSPARLVTSLPRPH